MNETFDEEEYNGDYFNRFEEDVHDLIGDSLLELYHVDSCDQSGVWKWIIGLKLKDVHFQYSGGCVLDAEFLTDSVVVRDQLKQLNEKNPGLMKAFSSPPGYFLWGGNE